MKRLSDLPPTHAKAESVIETIDSSLEYAKLWLSGAGAILILTLSGYYIAIGRISPLSALNKGLLISAVIFEAFEIYVLGRLVDNLMMCRAAHRIYIKLSPNDPTHAFVQSQTVMLGNRVKGSANIAMIVGVMILGLIIYAYGILIFNAT